MARTRLARFCGEWSIPRRARLTDFHIQRPSPVLVVWDYQSLNAFLAKPKAYISGTKMNFAGLKKPQDRANMIAYLRQQADTAAALPTAEEIAAESES